MTVFQPQTYFIDAFVGAHAFDAELESQCGLVCGLNIQTLSRAHSETTVRADCLVDSQMND